MSFFKRLKKRVNRAHEEIIKAGGPVKEVTANHTHQIGLFREQALTLADDFINWADFRYKMRARGTLPARIWFINLLYDRGYKILEPPRDPHDHSDCLEGEAHTQQIPE